MGTTFHGPSPWPHITPAIRTKGPRRAAIAYLGQDAPTLLPLRAGDVLVVNASTAALRAHATSPAALAHYLGAGVRVLSSPNLHAKVIVTDRRAVIGSANASQNSTVVDEAVIITDDPDLLAAAGKFIDAIDEITEVDAAFLDNANAEWAKGRALTIPGVTGRIRTEPDFLPSPVTRMFVWQTEEYDPSASEQREWATQQRRQRRAAGPTARYQLEWFRLDEPGHLKLGDVLIQVTGAWVYPPAVVHSEPVTIPRSRGAVAHFLRTRIDLEPIALPDAEKALADLGHRNPRLRTDHRIVSPQPARRTPPALEPLTAPQREGDVSFLQVNNRSAPGRSDTR